VAGENAFWAAKKTERRAARRDRIERKRIIEAELAGLSTLDENDTRWEDLLTTEESSSAESSK
jgi:hypothetical protein